MKEAIWTVRGLGRMLRWLKGGIPVYVDKGDGTALEPLATARVNMFARGVSNKPVLVLSVERKEKQT